jgi:hypothetical protein
MNQTGKEKLFSNPLYFITVKGAPDPDEQKGLETLFMVELCSFVSNWEKDAIAGFDMENGGSGLFIFLDEWKVLRILDFFRKHDLLESYEIISKPTQFISSNARYLEAYQEERNKIILDNYIRRNMSADDVLDRINENKSVPGFTLLPIEKEILSGVLHEDC